MTTRAAISGERLPPSPAAPPATRQLQAWQGDFGRAYTDRNPVDWRSRVAAFKRILAGHRIRSALEVGCNRGHNLTAVSAALGGSVELAGVEPNPYALDIARNNHVGARILAGNAFGLPFEDSSFDLVMTACVLIHVAPHDLPRALQEIHRVSRGFVLAIEYFAPQPTAIHYRGHDDLPWKRDFAADYRSLDPNLAVADSGTFGPDDGFDESNWWLLAKNPVPAGGRSREASA